MDLAHDLEVVQAVLVMMGGMGLEVRLHRNRTVGY
jgi:hypothetical protein